MEARALETAEKISVNMNIGTLSQMDLLVDGGYYSNRSDFINQAVRQVLDQKQGLIDQLSEQHRAAGDEWFIGILAGPSREMLLRAREQGRKLRIRGYGLLTIDKSLDELVMETVSEISVRGKVLCSAKLKEHFGLK